MAEEDAPEPILEPDLPIVDAHHHLWDARAIMATLPLPRHGFDQPVRLRPRYLLDEILEDMGSGHRVIATVYVEGHSMHRPDGPQELRPVGETEFANGMAAMAASGLYGPSRPCAGLVAQADLSLGDAVVRGLEAHLVAGAGRLRGVRQSSAWDADRDVLGFDFPSNAGLYLSDGFRRGFARLAPLKLSFDAWLLEPQLGDLISLARAFPDTSIILDHAGTPLGTAAYRGRREERWPIWRDSIGRLAELGNVTVKVGGFGMPLAGFEGFMARPPASSADLAEGWRPYVEGCIDAFGPDRCMFESNFPVDLATCTYPVLWNAFKRLTCAYSEDEKRALYAGVADRVYRLGLKTGAGL